MPPPKPPRARAPAPARRTKSPPYTVGFYLVPEFPMMAFASAIEPLRAANRMSGERLFAWQLYSRNGDPVRASNGIDIAVHGAVGADARLDLLLVCAGPHHADAADAAAVKWLRGLARSGVAIGGISLGAFVLADAGHRAAPRRSRNAIRASGPLPIFSSSTATASHAPAARPQWT